MELTLEAYRDIVRNVGTRADLSVLCRVSRGFRAVAEKALYNTLSLGPVKESVLLCRSLLNSTRLSAAVVAISIVFVDQDEMEEEASDSDDDDDSVATHFFLPDSFWTDISAILRTATSLQYLHVHLNNATNPGLAWILRDCRFQLKKFHSDFHWDHNLVEFLNKQQGLEDLYISDYRGLAHGGSDADDPLPKASSMSVLSLLECTFSEAAMDLVPGRPITHLKTCFSHTELGAKRDEMYDLLSKISLSRRYLQSLDLADSSYSEQFSTEMLAAIVTMRPLITELRYLGTLVLPVDGHERLQVYGSLRRLPQIECVEFEVSEWSPQPITFGAQRSLAGELRLYVPSIVRVVFVLDFERSVLSMRRNGWNEDPEIAPDSLWRDI